MTEQKLPELLPCPFCGGKARWDQGATVNGRVVDMISCGCCGLMGPCITNAEQAASTWNHRVSAPQEQRPPCSVCVGKGVPISGKPCICGGIGTEQAELEGLRARCYDLEKQLEEQRPGEPSEAAVRAVLLHSYGPESDRERSAPELMRAIREELEIAYRVDFPSSLPPQRCPICLTAYPCKCPMFRASLPAALPPEHGQAATAMLSELFGLIATAHPEVNLDTPEIAQRLRVVYAALAGDGYETVARIMENAKANVAPLVAAMRASSLPPQPGFDRECTCTGKCRGKEGLGAGWYCAMVGKASSLPPEPEQPAPMDEPDELLELREDCGHFCDNPNIGRKEGVRIIAYIDNLRQRLAARLGVSVEPSEEPAKLKRFELSMEDGIPHMDERPNGSYVRFADLADGFRRPQTTGKPE
jgi:Lar family restriction alleviation protein